MVQNTVQSAAVVAPQSAVASVGRRLSPAQAERRGRLVSAAYDLACEGGYAAVTIAAVCERAEVARATVYHHFGSKDHLIAEAIERWGAEIERGMRDAPEAEGSMLERVVHTLERVIASVEAQPLLFQAATMAIVSPDPGVDASMQRLASLVTGYLDTILYPDGALDTERLGMVLGHVLFSCLIQMAAGHRSSEEVARDLAVTAELALGAERA